MSPEQPSKRKPDEDRVVKDADHGDEVWDQVERQGEVGDKREQGEALSARGRWMASSDGSSERSPGRPGGHVVGTATNVPSTSTATTLRRQS